MRPAFERSQSPDPCISGGSLGTKSFTLASLMRELESIDPEIWGTDPMDPEELSDDPDSDELHVEDKEVQHVGIMNTTPPKLTEHRVPG